MMHATREGLHPFTSAETQTEPQTPPETPPQTPRGRRYADTPGPTIEEVDDDNQPFTSPPQSSASSSTLALPQRRDTISSLLPISPIRNVALFGQQPTKGGTVEVQPVPTLPSFGGSSASGLARNATAVATTVGLSPVIASAAVATGFTPIIGGALGAIIGGTIGSAIRGCSSTRYS